MKLPLIIRQEYRNRVAKRSFLLLTILTPILFAALIILPLKLAQLDSDDLPIAVIDRTGLYTDLFRNDSILHFDIIHVEGSASSLPSQQKDSYRAFVIIDDDLRTNPSALSIYSEKSISHDIQASIEHMLSQYVERQKLAEYNVPGIERMIADSHTEIHAKTYKMDDEGGAENSNTEVATFIGILATTLIYMFIFISGSQVMSSVVQEKVNRIVEVMVCSVRPWELMFGKIIAVALVSLTQIAIWLVLTTIFASVGAEMTGISLTTLASASAAAPSADDVSATQSILSSILSVDWPMIIAMFIIYFIGGYLLSASMFAAVGAAVDNESDTSQFMMPITLVVLFALYAGIYSAQNPDGPLAFWCSMIPLTSPIVMMVRIPFDVPAWQLATSLSILTVTVVLMIWLSARIYRVGILMYGKKPSWRELLRWFRY